MVTRASAGVALGDALLRNLMDTSCVDLVFLEQEMQLMVKDAVLADVAAQGTPCLLYTSPSPRDQRGSRMPSSA